jgi:hypothetical protein
MTPHLPHEKRRISHNLAGFVGLVREQSLKAMYSNQQQKLEIQEVSEMDELGSEMTVRNEDVCAKIPKEFL